MTSPGSHHHKKLCSVNREALVFILTLWWLHEGEKSLNWAANHGEEHDATRNTDRRLITDDLWGSPRGRCPIIPDVPKAASLCVGGHRFVAHSLGPRWWRNQHVSMFPSFVRELDQQKRINYRDFNWQPRILRKQKKNNETEKWKHCLFLFSLFVSTFVPYLGIGFRWRWEYISVTTQYALALLLYAA